MKKRLLAALLALSLTAALLPITASAFVLPETDWWTERMEGMTPEQQQRAQMERLAWYAWLATKYASMSFEDVPQDSWFYDGINYVWRNSLMSGVSNTRFAPNEVTTRAMVWTVLARMMGASTAAAEGQEWYEPGVAWAIQQGLGDGTDPNGSLTREYLAQMLWKCAGGPLTPTDLSGYPDSKQISDYAYNGMRWAVANKILQGIDGRLAPKGSVTRAELAAMVMRFKYL